MVEKPTLVYMPIATFPPHTPAIVSSRGSDRGFNPLQMARCAEVRVGVADNGVGSVHVNEIDSWGARGVEIETVGLESIRDSVRVDQVIAGSGAEHSLVVTSDGRLISFGNNLHGQVRSFLFVRTKCVLIFNQINKKESNLT
jgi:hypothetical protein